jgi:alpha-L-fucosidase
VPKQANTDQWCKAIASFGGKWATLVAKHECGFALWPTKAESGGFKYNYSVGEDQDIVRQFAESCAGYGIKIGLYYSVNRNSYLNVWDPGAVRAGSPINQTQYADIVMQQLTELWTNYGDIAEIW